MKLNIIADEEFQVGIKRLAPILNVELTSDGLTVKAVQGDVVGAALKDGVGTIYYQKKHHFFRELGVFVENARKSDSFYIQEDNFFKTLGIMINVTHSLLSNNGFCKITDYLALMGYNFIQLYMEDTVKLEGRPFFGYMQNSYTVEDLRAMDDYAFDYGIEVTPQIECYGHMQKYLHWAEANEIKDTNTILLARSEKTFEFLDQLIGTVATLELVYTKKIVSAPVVKNSAEYIITGSDGVTYNSEVPLNSSRKPRVSYRKVSGLNDSICKQKLSFFAFVVYRMHSSAVFGKNGYTQKLVFKNKAFE